MSACNSPGCPDHPADEGDKLPPTSRLKASTHLANAAQARLDGSVEAYHLAAAAAEGLVELRIELAKISTELRKISTELAKRPR